MEKDERMACQWFHTAALMDEDYAQANVAFMYAEGTAVAWDAAKAMQFNRMAASKGNTTASAWLMDNLYPPP